MKLNKQSDDSFWSHKVKFKMGGEMITITQRQLKDYLMHWLTYRMDDCLGAGYSETADGCEVTCVAWRPFVSGKLIIFWQRKDGNVLMVPKAKK